MGNEAIGRIGMELRHGPEPQYRLVACPLCGGSGRDPEKVRRGKTGAGVETFKARCRYCLGLGKVFEEIENEQ